MKGDNNTFTFTEMCLVLPVQLCVVDFTENPWDLLWGARSRWQNRRTLSSPPSTNTSKIHLHVEYFSQNTCWTLAEDIIKPKLQERSPHNQEWWKKKKKGIGMGPCTLGKSYERGKVPSPRESPSLVGTWAETERELQRLRGECSTQLAGGRTERDQNKGPMPPPCTPQPEICVCWCMQGLGAEIQASEDRHRETTGVDWSLKGLEYGPSLNWGCVQEGAQVHHWSLIVNASTQRKGQGPP